MRGRIVIVRQDGETSTLKGHRDRVTSVAFSPLGTLSRDDEHRSRRADLEPRHGRADSFSPAQHGRTRREVQPGRALARHGGTAREPLGRGPKGRTSSGSRGTRERSPRSHSTPHGRTIVTGGADGTVRTYRCVICGGVDELIPLAGSRLAGTRRQLTQASASATSADGRLAPSAVVAGQKSRRAQLRLGARDRERAAQVAREPDVEHLARTLLES